MSRNLHDYSYSYPENLVARYPLESRDQSRLMVLDRVEQKLHHHKFSDITDFFKAGDVLVINDSRVFPSRLVTTRKTGGRQEIFLLHHQSGVINDAPTHHWIVMVTASRKIKKSDVFDFEGLTVTFLDDHNDAQETRLVELKYHGDLSEVLKRVGHVPLPPYLGREDETSDHQRYQTIYARESGSVAAPTAGLHFTDEILQKLKTKGVIVAPVTLHVGLGTFLPVRTADITKHKMHSETFFLSDFSRNAINQAKKDGHRITAVGTTSARVLESLADDNGVGDTSFLRDTRNSWQSTNIFIYPPYEFKIVDRLITNFHQSESTLLMLVSAFAGREFVLSAYQEAIAKEYRLFSYGDCMMVE